jgi:hypothetical protein
MPRRSKEPPAVAGWREWVSLPDLGIDPIKAKLDTGARTSSLHAYDIEVFERAGRPMVRFKVHPIQRETRNVVVAEAPLKEHRTVKSSSGHTERRLVIVSDLVLMGRRWPIEITLTRRDAMGFRMLLGRRALKRRFLVDSARSFVGGPNPTHPPAVKP